ncbi:hypothetical protein [Azospirillum sp.]|uniref:hypothetical protein n=1 Tax=Azospirillum sp. TaxID=34012 RepID=UPI002D30033D|nr:hypothetical protein [Azospirillum sp.]HYD70033.1 hypothetical protein [Azospirillum sp.]
MKLDWLAEPADGAHDGAPDGAEAMAAVAAGCALLAVAEGADADAIRARLDGAPAATFDEALQRLRAGGPVAEDEALTTVRAVKGDAAQAQAVARACCRRAANGDELAPAQVAAARRICEALNLSPTQFGF